MKNLLTIFLVSLALTGFGQTQISTNQIKNGAVTQEKLATDAVRPINSGVLTDPELTFATYFGQTYTVTVDEDIPLTLAASGNVVNGTISIMATGDGVHNLTFPSTWIMDGDTYSPGSVQEIFLRYNGVTVVGELRRLIAIDAIPTALSSAVVTNTPPTELHLTFNEAVGISVNGWSISASGGAVTFDNVSGSGTTTPVLIMSRAITSAETVTISYDQVTGSTQDLLGNELTTVTNFSVTPPPALPDPEIPQFDRIVGPTPPEYATVQLATNAAVSGDIIGIKAGTYRETVVGKSGVTYRAFPGETVILSGMELVGNTGWTVHSGSIYKKTITLPITGYAQTNYGETTIGNTNIIANQILKDGLMQPEAQYPNRLNLPADYFDQSKLRHINSTSQFTFTQITDAGLAIGTHGSLVGGKIGVQGWFIAQYKTITGHSGNQITFGGPGSGNLSGSTVTNVSLAGNPSYNKYYFVFGKLGLLDAAKEWFYDGTQLYFWQTGGGTPTGLEYKARNWGFDLRGKSNVTIEDIQFVGVDPVKGDGATTGIIIDNIRAKYMNHGFFEYRRQHPGFGNAIFLGSFLTGANNIVRNSEFYMSFSTCLWLGENALVNNNKFEYINYEGNWGAPTQLYGTTANHTITNNSMNWCGRGALDFGPLNSGGRHDNVEFAHNWVSHYGVNCWDLGATYAHGGLRMDGMNFHHNWIAHNHAPKSGSMNDPGGGIVTGSGAAFYWDQGTGPRASAQGLHHNVSWGDASAGMYHQTSSVENPAGALINVWNNTFSTSGIYSSYTTYVTSHLDVHRNNIYRDNFNVNHTIDGGAGNVANVLFQSSVPTFSGGDPDVIGGHAFIPTSGSAGRNGGVSSFTGAYGGVINVPVIGTGVDIGAYDFDDPNPWVAGYNATPTVADGIINDNEFTFSGPPAWTYSSNWKTGYLNNDATYTVALNATATYPFTGSEVELFMEKCNNSAVARITIRNSSAATVQTADVDTYVVDPGGATTVCPAGSLESVFTSSAFSGGVCTGCTIEIKLQTQNTGTTPQRTALVLDKLVITP